jgi:hypothetical protein
MGLLDKIIRRRPQGPNDRRRWLIANGRITEGLILDCDVNSAGEEIAYYTYTLNGVDFESSEVLTPEQRRDRVRYAPGQKIGVRYDPRAQGNSIIE